MSVIEDESNIDFYVTRTVEIHIEDIIDCLDVTSYEAFLDKLSELHSNTEMLMDIAWDEIQPMKLQVSGDCSEAVQSEEFV